MPARAIASPSSMPWRSWMKATSSTMKTPGSRIERRSFEGALRADQPIAAAVKGPGAAERAVPRAAAREFDRGARVERAKKIFPPVAQQVAGRHQIVERMDKARRRALGHGGNGTRDRGHIRPRLDCGKHERHSCLALAFQHSLLRPRHAQSALLL